ncbi:hypothetical protein R1sor_013224 [Riccia sorocarpa]|uniref:Uncharacterized protein n=1 Tax=Riccia sorocarpa TaxID=122646 RepID=A0ABD3H9I4_9MARC
MCSKWRSVVYTLTMLEIIADTSTAFLILPSRVLHEISRCSVQFTHRVPAVPPQFLFGSPLPGYPPLNGVGGAPFSGAGWSQFNVGVGISPFMVHGVIPLPAVSPSPSAVRFPVGQSTSGAIPGAAGHFLGGSSASQEPPAVAAQEPESGKQKKPKAKWEYWNTIVLIECKRAEELENQGKKSMDRCVRADQKWLELQPQQTFHGGRWG